MDAKQLGEMADLLRDVARLPECDSDDRAALLEVARKFWWKAGQTPRRGAERARNRSEVESAQAAPLVRLHECVRDNHGLCHVCGRPMHS